jgi:hypothetical protein
MKTASSLLLMMMAKERGLQGFLSLPCSDSFLTGLSASGICSREKVCVIASIIVPHVVSMSPIYPLPFKIAHAIVVIIFSLNSAGSGVKGVVGEGSKLKRASPDDDQVLLVFLAVLSAVSLLSTVVASGLVDCILVLNVLFNFLESFRDLAESGYQ